MGNTTIIEIDHDKLDEIEKQPDLFIQQILEQGKAGHDFVQQIEGGQIVAFFPRYDENRKYRAWERWKFNWTVIK